MFGQYAVLLLLGFHPERKRVRRGHLMTIFFLAPRCSVAWSSPAVHGGAGTTRLFDPLRERNAPSLVFLITAIGASFVIQEFVHYILPQSPTTSSAGNAQIPIRLVAPEEQSRSSAQRSPTSR